MSKIVFPVKYSEYGEIAFDLKGYKIDKVIRAIIRINGASIPKENPRYSLCGICGDYIIQHPHPKKLNFRRISPLYFYGTLTNLKQNRRSDISNLDSKFDNFKEKNVHSSSYPASPYYSRYYKIPLSYLCSEMIIETNRFGLIDPIFKNIIRAIRENPSTLSKKRLNGNNFKQQLFNFPIDFVQELEKYKDIYSIYLYPTFYFNKKKKRFTQGQYSHSRQHCHSH